MNVILVVGGGGYIGSHTCLDLCAKGFRPVVYDNFSNGHPEFVQWGELETGDIRDRSRLDQVFRKYRPAAVIHFAALIEVGASVLDPVSFFENNVTGSLTLLAAAAEAGCKKIVFSSTCATYGIPEQIPIGEEHSQNPINPYGRSKFIVEQMLKELADHAGFRPVVLRYFNAAGAEPEGRIGEWHTPETHAVPLAIEAALGWREDFKIFGTDYETRDGSCVRDFIHVLDLAAAHTRAVEYLLGGGETVTLNLGTGSGTTVRELIAAVKAISGRDFAIIETGRRAGDSPVLVADNSHARRVLGWEPKHDLDSIVSSAWRWHSQFELSSGHVAKRAFA